jgi:protein tyrosine/serine phosphatase
MTVEMPIATSELPSPPFVAVEGVVNFRDTIGGYPITGSGSKSVKRGFVYRSAVLSRITNDGMKTLVALGIRVIFDLRSHGEVGNYLIPGVVMTRIPVLSGYLPMEDRYHNLLSDNSTAALYAEVLTAGLFRRVFEHIRDKPEEPFLIHCALGKDRTGVLVALIIRIAGVSDLDVGNEYELTAIGNPPPAEGWGSYEINQALRKHLKASMRWLDEKYGGIEDYFKDVLKFQDQDIRKIKKNLVAQEKPT